MSVLFLTLLIFCSASVTDVSFIKQNDVGDGEKPEEPKSLRAKPYNVADDNVLDVTPEFQQHIAKKLSGSLDTAIEESSVWSSNGNPEEERDCFRLFQKSVPGSDFTSRDNFVQKKRKISSSSSDEETKLSEASVTIVDIHKQQELLFPNKLTRGTVEHITKKRKKKKKVKESNCKTVKTETKNIDVEKLETVKKKKKKKKKSKENGKDTVISKSDKNEGELSKSMKKRLRLKKLKEAQSSSQ